MKKISSQNSGFLQFCHCEPDPKDKQKNIYKVWTISQISQKFYKLSSGEYSYNISNPRNLPDETSWRRFLENLSLIAVIEKGKHPSEDVEKELNYIYDILAHRPEKDRDKQFFDFLKEYFDSLKSNDLNSISCEEA